MVAEGVWRVQVIEASKAAQYARTSLGEYLRAQGYSRAFTFNYVVPMCAAVWSVPNAQVLDFPVQMLVQFWVNHHLLNVLERPVWRVVKGRSRSYVERVLQGATPPLDTLPASPRTHTVTILLLTRFLRNGYYYLLFVYFYILSLCFYLILLCFINVWLFVCPLWGVRVRALGN
jgi:hypothetical protein